VIPHRTPSAERGDFDTSNLTKELSMTRNNLLLFVACGLFFTIGCGKAEFKEYVSTAGKYKVQMPGTPKEETQNLKGPNGENLSLSTATVTKRDGGFAVMFSDLSIPAGESEEQTQMRLDVSREGALKTIKGKLIKETKIALDGKYPGRDIEAASPDGKQSVRMRIYYVGTRLYQVMLVGTPTSIASPDAAKFLDSFALTK